ncbi:tRNA pseudouridine(55) synthase TruB [bacterium]|nr:tRNA pseudouridine(55) synthase TruB [bacterium]
MDGIILIDKPEGITSHDVVDVLRREFKTRQIGHAGTLDPLSTGLLILGINKGTKILGDISGYTKEYIVDLKLGIETDSQDRLGSVVKEVKDFEVSEEVFRQTCFSFLGKTKQIPPMFSAKKINGKKMYELARKGIVIKREPIDIEIFAMDILSFDGVIGKLRVSCSKGTYVRTLSHDIGIKLGVGGIMQDLRRTKIGKYLVDDAITLAKLKELSFDQKSERIIPVSKLEVKSQKQ